MMRSRGAFLNLLKFEPDVWEAELQALSELGCEHVELWVEFEPRHDELLCMGGLLNGFETIMHGPFIDLSLASACDEIGKASAARCARAVELAGYLGCRVVTLHAGYYGFFEDHADALVRLAERMDRFAAVRDPIVTLENLHGKGGVKRQALGSLGDMAAFAEVFELASFTLDVGHALHTDGQAGIAAFVAEHTNRIHNIHLHDALPGERSHLALGDGVLDLATFMTALVGAGYAGYLTLETLGSNDTAASWERLVETAAAAGDSRLRQAV